ncbi:MAG TPA: ATP-dependent DNA helicase [Acidimicrobiia bacterium]|nr:ATP-dependent DNA helicase [Acidimicrobiia bacterium]
MATASLETRVDPDGWDLVVASADGPQLVVAGPGAGKTEFLVRRALHLIAGGLSPDNLLLLSFSRRGAADLRSRVTAGLRRSFTVIPASTFHSFAFRLVEAHAERLRGWSRVPALLTGPEQVALVEHLLADEDPAEWPLPLRGLLGTHTLAGEVADFVLRCQENLVSPDDLAARARERADWRALPGFLERYRAALTAEGRIDYGTLQATAVELLDDHDVRALVAAQFRYLLVDEYQDTTLAQARLLQLLYLPHRNLTVAGDPYQSVYSFRGAALANVAEFPAAFPDAAGQPARRLVLTTSFRVPAEILAAAVRVTAGGGLPGEAGPVAPAPGRGVVETYAFDQQTHEAEWIAAEVQRAHLRDRIPYRHMAVLVRSKRRFLPELSRALERRGIPHEEPDRRLVDHPAVRVVLDCVRAAASDGIDQLAALRRLLLGTPAALTLSAYRELEREQARTGDPWTEVVRRGVPGGAAIAGLISDPSWALRRPAIEGLWHLWSTLPHIPDVARSPHRRAERAAWSSLAQVLGRLNERDPGATLADYLRWSEAEDFEATPLLEYTRPDEDRLTLATLHQAKGVEFDVIFIADALEGVFPDLRLRESLLGVRHLSPFLPVETGPYAQFRLQEEMRLAYTAMCRARRRVVWTCTPGAGEQGPGSPSRFLSMVVPEPEKAGLPAEAAEPSTPLEAEAWLRRLLADPGEPPPRRLAALDALVAPGAWRARPPEELAGVLERGPDDGVIPLSLALSPSQADSYLQCPRRYAFQRWLHVGDEGSVYASLGSVIHEVLEVTERAALEAGKAHGALDDAMGALDRLWDPAAFGGGEWAAAWRRRAQEVLHHLYERWPSVGRVAAVEVPLATEIEGIRWRGRADRIEVRGDPPAVHVIDYKTARSAVPYAEAATSLQLGFYMLAAAEDPRLASLGRVAGAEMWFPAAPGQKVATRPLDPARIDEVRGLISRAAAGIRQENWAPSAGDHCRHCAVRQVCPEWPEGREAYLG